jgi:xanthine dehydrogenase accessory factor
MNESLINLLERAAALQRLGRRVVACLVVKARGSTPQSAGALMLVDEDFNTFGTIGGGCVEAEVRRRAHEMLSRGGSGVLTFKLDHDYGWDDGLICGGTIEMAVAPLPDAAELQRVIDDVHNRRATTLTFECAREADVRACPEQAETPASLLQRYTLDLPPRDRLYIAGAGHVGQALARLALPLEFETTIFDDREDLLQRFAPAGCLAISGDIAEQLRAAPIDERTYVVIVTRGHKHDEQALHAVLSPSLEGPPQGQGVGEARAAGAESSVRERSTHPPAPSLSGRGRRPKYLGMIGSRRKIKLIFDDLKDMGVDPKALADVHAPIGLDIGSVSVEEIAMSIAAELVQVRRAGHRSPIRIENGADSRSAIENRLASATPAAGIES